MLYKKRVIVFVNLILFTVITLALTTTLSAFHCGLICFTKLSSVVFPVPFGLLSWIFDLDRT